MAQAARNVTRVVLELGGKSALVVRADADLALASRIGAVNTTTLAGQGCALLTRHLVHRDVFADYVAALADRLAAAVPGDPADARTTLGPLISATHRDRVASLVRDRAAAVAVAERLRAGRISVNDGAAADVRLPFGGFGRSGIGREFGPEGVLEYTELQTLQW